VEHRGDSCVGGGILADDGGGSGVAVVVPRVQGWFRGVGTVHGPVGIGRRQRVGWVGIDQPSGQQDAFAGYLL